MKRHLGVVQKETEHSSSAAAANLAESQACHELLTKEGMAESNNKITCDLRALLQPETSMEDGLRCQIRDVQAQIEATKDHSKSL